MIKTEKVDLAVPENVLSYFEEAMSQLPKYIYSYREVGFEPPKDLEDEYYYIQRGYYLAMASLGDARHHLNVAGRKANALSNLSLILGNDIDNFSVQKAVNDFNNDINGVIEGINDILLNFRNSAKLQEIITDAYQISLSGWTKNYFFATVSAAKLLQLEVPNSLNKLYNVLYVKEKSVKK